MSRGPKLPAPIPAASASASSSKPSKPTAGPAAPQPLPSSFSTEQARRAVTALHAHHAKHAKEKEATELISREEHVWLVLNTKVMPKKKSNKPIRIQLPNPPLPPPPTTSVCLITKSPQREYKDLLAAHNIKFIARVVGVEKLKGKHAPFEARRQLCAEHDVFLVDDRVLERMPKLLGKIWFDAKKQPVPVTLARKDLKGELSRAISSTYFHESLGTSNAVRVSTAQHHTPEQTADNLLAAIPQVVARLAARNLPAADGEHASELTGWDLVHSIGIKTSGSVMLPVWSAKAGGDRFDVVDKLSGKKRQAEGDDEEDLDVIMDKVTKKMKGKAGKEGKEGKDAKEGKKSGKAAAVSPAKPAAAPGPTTLPPKVTSEQAPTASKAAAVQGKKIMAGKPSAAAQGKEGKKVSSASARSKTGGKAAIVGSKRK